LQKSDLETALRLQSDELERGLSVLKANRTKFVTKDFVVPGTNVDWPLANEHPADLNKHREYFCDFHFDHAFAKPPKVVIGVTKFSFGHPYNESKTSARDTRFQVEVTEVHEGWFRVKFETWHDSIVMHAGGWWLAFDDNS
jgi:hypothetical protein